MAEHDECTVLTAAEYDEAIESTLRQLGYTREQLADMAGQDDFDTPAAFMAWHMVRGRSEPS